MMLLSAEEMANTPSSMVDSISFMILEKNLCDMNQMNISGKTGLATTQLFLLSIMCARQQEYIREQEVP